VIAVVAIGGGSDSSPVVSQVPTTPVQPPPPPPPPPAAQTKPKTTTTATPAAGTLSLAPGETLKVGSSGAEVKTLQQALKSLGLYDGPVDGDFGAGTAAAVGEFQRTHGLGDDGVVGPSTAEALNAAAGA
jgi:peptidoglycan hydrolase-like protein with peptidoglycan-binding domain